MSRRWPLKSFLLLCSCLWPLAVFAQAKAPPTERTEFLAPANVQAVVLKKSIAIHWVWKKPDLLPVYKEFGFEIKRSDGRTFFTPALSFQDDGLSPGVYAYSVRVRAFSKEKGKKIFHVSDWSETVSGRIVEECAGPPRIELTVTPTQKVYSAIPSLRFRLQGSVRLEKGCSLLGAKHHIDTGRGISHTRPLPVDKEGRFDAFVSAIGPEDEIPSGTASFSVSVTAESEAGASTSDVYTLDVELQNPYAPR